MHLFVIFAGVDVEVVYLCEEDGAEASGVDLAESETVHVLDVNVVQHHQVLERTIGLELYRRHQHPSHITALLVLQLEIPLLQRHQRGKTLSKVKQTDRIPHPLGHCYFSLTCPPDIFPPLALLLYSVLLGLQAGLVETAADLEHLHVAEDVCEVAGLTGILMDGGALLCGLSYDILHQGETILRVGLPDLVDQCLEVGRVGIGSGDTDGEAESQFS
jgi:hypothetical protein